MALLISQPPFIRWKSQRVRIMKMGSIITHIFASNAMCYNFGRASISIYVKWGMNDLQN